MSRKMAQRAGASHARAAALCGLEWRASAGLRALARVRRAEALLLLPTRPARTQKQCPNMRHFAYILLLYLVDCIYLILCLFFDDIRALILTCKSIVSLRCFFSNQDGIKTASSLFIVNV